MSYIKNLMRSILTYIIVGITGLIILPIMLIIICLPEKYRYNNRVYFFILDVFYKVVVYGLFMPVKIKGKENLPKEPAILIGNHQSSIDIPMIGLLCERKPHVWLILKYYANHPILGLIVRRMNITVDRENSPKSAGTIAKALRFLENYGCHLVLFPEAKRYTDGKIHTFKPGFALFARKTGRPVIPVYMKNNYKIFPPDSFLARYSEIEIIVGPAFRMHDDETDELFVARVHDWYLKQ